VAYPDAPKPRPLKQRKNRFLVMGWEFGRRAACSRIADDFERMITISHGISVMLIAICLRLFKPNEYTTSSSIDHRHQLNLAIPLFMVVLVDANSIDP
jgi:hypothetical protein